MTPPPAVSPVWHNPRTVASRQPPPAPRVERHTHVRTHTRQSRGLFIACTVVLETNIPSRASRRDVARARGGSEGEKGGVLFPAARLRGLTVIISDSTTSEKPHREKTSYNRENKQQHSKQYAVQRGGGG